MSCTYEGMIVIPLEEFWAFVKKYHDTHNEIVYGVPSVNKSNQTIEILFAASSDGHPNDWSVKPEALRQWDGPNVEVRGATRLYRGASPRL